MPVELTVAVFAKGDTDATIRVKVTQNKLPANITGYTMKMYGKGSDGVLLGTLTGLVTDGPGGVADFDAATWLTSAPLSIKFQIESTTPLGKHRRSVRDYWLRVKNKVEDWVP